MSIDKFEMGAVGRVISVIGEHVIVDIGDAKVKVLSPFVEVKEGDLVIVHRGFILNVIRDEDVIDGIKKLEGDI